MKRKELAMGDLRLAIEPAQINRPQIVVERTRATDDGQSLIG
jgi:hypothetical protein